MTKLTVTKKLGTLECGPTTFFAFRKLISVIYSKKNSCHLWDLFSSSLETVWYKAKCCAMHLDLHWRVATTIPFSRFVHIKSKLNPRFWEKIKWQKKFLEIHQNLRFPIKIELWNLVIPFFFILFFLKIWGLVFILFVQKVNMGLLLQHVNGDKDA